jgi:signal transduction histidine kinase
VRVDGTVLLHQPARDSAALAALTRSSDGEKPSAIPNELIAPSIQIGRRALQEMATVTAETEIVIPHGKVAVELRVAPVGPEEIVVFARDITARKRLEAETAAMFEKERQLLEMKTRFISVTSHEFRTPMAAALGSAQLLHNHLDRLAPEKREELFERINTSLHRMTVMLDDVLLLNRMDGHRIELRLAPADLRAFLRNVIEEIRLGDQGAHPFELQADPHDAQPFVTDLNLLHHIFSNLLSNAVRYSAAGKPIAVWVENHPGYTRVVVEDQGIGIPVADRARLFQPFERGSNVGNIKGTGLGLNIVKRMTELLGGTVALDSPADGGSRFSLVLPHLTVPASP